MTMFHSQLSSIMEKLVFSAITEINKLMVDYCALLRLELNREKLDNGMLRKKLRLVQTNADQGVHFTTGELLDECQNAAENGKLCVPGDEGWDRHSQCAMLPLSDTPLPPLSYKLLFPSLARSGPRCLTNVGQ